MRLISLIICFIFVVFLYILDIRREKSFPKALVVPLLWMMLIFSRSVSSWINVDYSVELESSDDWSQGNALDRNITFIFITIGMVILWRKNVDWPKIFKNNGWFIWLYYYCALSILWSDLPFVSLKRLLRDLTNIIMVLIVLTEHEPFVALKAIMKKSMYLLIPLSIVFIKFFPEYGRYWTPFGGEPVNGGVTGSKNGLGVLCLVAGLFFFWDLLQLWRNRKIASNNMSLSINSFYLAMIIYLFVLANSQSSLASFIVGISILIGFSLIRNKIKFVNLIIFHIMLIVVVLLSTDIVGILIQSLGRDATLTDRTSLWSDLLKIDINPLIGTGYRSFWGGTRLEHIWAEYWWHPKQAHNGYIETYLNLGIIGLFSLIALLISTFKKSIKELFADFEKARFHIAVLAIVIIYNYTEAAFIVGGPLWFLFLFSVIKIPKSEPVYVRDYRQTIA